MSKVERPKFEVVTKNVLFPKSKNRIYDKGAILLDIPKYHIKYNLYGAGQRFMIIDDGYNDHGNLMIPTILKAFGFSNPRTYSGHGNATHGVIAMKGNPVMGGQPLAEPNHAKVIGKKTGSLRKLGDGIKLARELDIKFINISAGSHYSARDAYVEEQCRLAYEEGRIIVVASGNENDKTGFPANLKWVIAIGAVNFDNKDAPWSNGDENLDFCVYGVNVISTNGNGGHSEFNGTSFSCPYATSCIMMIHERFYDLFGLTLNMDETYAILKEYRRDLKKEGFDLKTGHGLITLGALEDDFEKYIISSGRDDLRSIGAEWRKTYVKDIKKDPKATRPKERRGWVFRVIVKIKSFFSKIIR